MLYEPRDWMWTELDETPPWDGLFFLGIWAVEANVRDGHQRVRCFDGVFNSFRDGSSYWER